MVTPPGAASVSGAAGQSPKIVKTIGGIGGSNMVTLAKPGQIGGKQTIVINKSGAPGATIKGICPFLKHKIILLAQVILVED